MENLNKKNLLTMDQLVGCSISIKSTMRRRARVYIFGAEFVLEGIFHVQEKPKTQKSQ